MPVATSVFGRRAGQLAHLVGLHVGVEVLREEGEVRAHLHLSAVLQLDLHRRLQVRIRALRAGPNLVAVDRDGLLPFLVPDHVGAHVGDQAVRYDLGLVEERRAGLLAFRED
jgi:hypothetical protein